MKKKNMAVIGMVVGCLMMVAGAAWAGVAMPGAANGTFKFGNLVLLLNPNSCLEKMNWDSAVSRAKSLASGQCGLTDGSKAGQWRLATPDELHRLGNAELKLGNFGYWSDSVTLQDYRGEVAQVCYMHSGWMDTYEKKTENQYFLPVRNAP